MQCLEASRNRFKCAEYAQNLFGIFAKFNGCAVYSKQVAYIETAGEQCTELAVIEFKNHAVEMRLYNSCLIVAHCAYRVVLDVSATILYHYGTVLVIEVCYGKGIAWKVVEETLLGLKIVLHGAMEIHVVAC